MAVSTPGSTACAQEAEAQGVSSDTLRVLDDVRFDQDIIRRDRAQGVFSQTFLEFAGRMVNANRMQVGASRLEEAQENFRRN